jgi:hypothetical protein
MKFLPWLEDIAITRMRAMKDSCSCLFILESLFNRMHINFVALYVNFYMKTCLLDNYRSQNDGFDALHKVLPKHYDNIILLQ